MPPPSWPIQTQPQGLLSLLSLKNRGQNPSQLADTLQSVVELRDWLATSLYEDLEGSYSLDPANFPTSSLYEPTAGDICTVPDGQVWWVAEHNVSFYFPGTVTQLDISALAPSQRTYDDKIITVGKHARFMSTIDGFIPVNGHYFHGIARCGFWAVPGDRLGAFVCADYVSTSDAVFYTRLRIARLAI